MRLPKIIEGIKIMKYQCAKCETIFEHEKYLTECEGEKVCPICETVEPVYKLRNPLERVVRQGALSADVACSNCEHYCPDEDDLPGNGFCNELAHKSNDYKMFVKADFYCKYFLGI